MSSPTLAIASGQWTDFGHIVNSKPRTVAELAQVLRNALSKPAPFSLLDLELADEALQKKLKKAPWFSPAQYTGNRRIGADLVSCSAVVLDVDRVPMTRESLLGALDALGCSYIAATSTRHGLGGLPRYRVIVPLLTPVSGAHYRAVWEHLAALIPGVDPGAPDATRLNYLPYAPEGAVGHEVIEVSDRPWFDASTVEAPLVVDAEPGEILTELDATTRPDLEWALQTPTLLEHCATRPPWNDTGLKLLSLGGVTGEGGQLFRKFSAAAPGKGSETADDWLKANARTKPRRDFRAIINLAEELSGEKRPSKRWGADDLDLIEAEPVSKVGAVPKANHLCTDQKNAARIAAHFNNQLIVSLGGTFFAWTGTHWAADEGDAYRFTGALTNIVQKEAGAARAKADKALSSLDPALLQAAAEHPKKNALGKSDAGKTALELVTVADALEKWSVLCESKRTQDAAIGFLRKLLRVSEDNLDASPWLLNCLNGTVDLRTGALHPHDPLDYLTKVVPVNYVPDAKAPRFEAFLTDIMGGDATLVKFLQRWLGYSATGDVREQKFVVHIGKGANGKGTLLTAVEDVLGDYADTAPLGLLTQGDKKDTDNAVLFRRRLVTAHEPDDNAVLSEGFVKQATGGDRLRGRRLFKDGFTFKPTHHLQMLTNHKPQIKGTDFGIWRRVLLVTYPVKFGTAEDIAAGRADRLRDDSLPAALAQEREGILRWLVEGAVAWFNEDGLHPPEAVKVAGREYQSDQDRVGQFVDECCRLDRTAWAPVGGLEGLYPAYQGWCKDAGITALGRNRFITELERVVPGYSRVDKWPDSRNKRVRCITGIVLDRAGDL
jgi:P4 family phage/plasmid primase-like protien